MENTVGRRIVSLREQAGFNQVEFAARLEVSQTIVSQYESGDRRPGSIILIRIAKLFNITVPELIEMSWEEYATYRPKAGSR